jgi:hypothetical protein
MKNRVGARLLRVTRTSSLEYKACLHSKTRGLDAQAHLCIARQTKAVQCLYSLEADLILWLRCLFGWVVSQAC